MPNVAAAETASKSAVLPGIIKMVVNVIATCIMSNPLPAAIDVRRIGMSWVIVKVSILFWGMRRLDPRRTSSRNVFAPTDFGPPSGRVAFMLSEGGERKGETNHQQSNQFFHRVVTFL